MKTAKKNKLSGPNLNQSWDSRETMSFRTKRDMLSHKETHEKKIDKLREKSKHKKFDS